MEGRDASRSRKWASERDRARGDGVRVYHGEALQDPPRARSRTITSFGWDRWRRTLCVLSARVAVILPLWYTWATRGGGGKEREMAKQRVRRDTLAGGWSIEWTRWD